MLDKLQVMTLNYDLIRKNLQVYQEAKEIFPILSDFENGQVSHHIMSKLGLTDFAQFHNFLKQNFNLGFNPIMKGMNWRRLKPMLLENTKNPRFKKFLLNRTQRQFNEILANGETFDRYLNGRWISKPGLTKRGRMTYGRRSDEKIESLSSCAVPLINYIIENNIEVYSDSKDHYQSFKNQSQLQSTLTWYCHKELNFSNVPKREIDVTRKLLDTLVNIVDETKIDFRKLNSEYIINSFSEKIKNSMSVKEGTRLKCISDCQNGYGKKGLTKDQYYEVRSSNLNHDGYLQVLVDDDTNRSYWYRYSNFEDIQSHRDDLLDSLFG